MMLGLPMTLYREWAIVFVSRGELPTSTGLRQSTNTYSYIDKLYSHIEWFDIQRQLHSLLFTVIGTLVYYPSLP